jgi:4,5-DOPA dioxygenase extradiol
MRLYILLICILIKMENDNNILLPNSLFLGHGSPMIALNEDEYTDFLLALGKKYKPKVIIIFTAHWESKKLKISSIKGNYSTIHDFGGFPKALFEIQYPAPGDPETAEYIHSLYKNAGIEAELDTKRGLDHGSWTLLHRVYPEAKIPVVQISVNPKLPAKEQIRIGKVLTGMNEKGALVIGSGQSVHSFQRSDYSKGEGFGFQWAKDFDNWIVKKVQEKDSDSLYDYENLAPKASWAIETKEHFVPLLIAYGASLNGKDEQVEEINKHYWAGGFSYLCLKF